jgi:sarcospan
MTTTVPQNIKGLNIMGRHKPTRTSLRHSRMIVINKNFQSPHKNSLNIKCGILARIFLILQIIIGVALLAMGLFLLVVWAPHTRLRDNPYWSGIMLILSGVLGLILLNYKRTPLNRTKENIFMFVKVRSLGSYI